MTDRWVPEPQPADGPDGRGESGSSDTLTTRRETEIAASSGRFPDGDELRDPSNPIEPEDPAPAVDEAPARSPEDPASGW